VIADIKRMLDTSRTKGARAPQAALSHREVEVLRLFAAGFTVSEIADQLNRGVKTISCQKMDAIAKLDLKSDLDIYAYAREHGLAPCPLRGHALSPAEMSPPGPFGIRPLKNAKGRQSPALAC
jgi:DNA-binding CsgD family transcriptional regulator